METEGSCEYMEQAVGDSCKGALLQLAREPVYMYVCIISLCGGHGEGGTAHLGGRLQNITHEIVNLECQKWIMCGMINASRILVGRLEGKNKASETRRRPWLVIKNVSNIRCGAQDCITNQWWALVIKIVNIQVPHISENFVSEGGSHFSVVKNDSAQ